MPSYEQIRLIGGPCDGETHMWDGGDYFEVREVQNRTVWHAGTGEIVERSQIPTRNHTYRREIDTDGNRTSRFVYLGG